MAYIQITVGIDAASRIETSDFAHPDMPGHRVVTLSWEPVTIHLPSSDDATLVKVTGDLIDKLGRLRYAALARIDAQPQDVPEYGEIAQVGPSSVPGYWDGTANLPDADPESVA